MKVSEGFPNPHNQVCKLNKALYALKQASRQWFAKLVTELTLLGFSQSKNDYSLFINKTANHITLAAVYVDDIIITGTHPQTIDILKSHLHQKFSIKDLGLLNYFLGIEVTYVPAGIVLSQMKFIKELLHEASAVLDVKGKAVTPLPMHLKLQSDDGPLCSTPELYRSIVGKLNYLTNTRPDLAYTVQTLSQFLKHPCLSHVSALIHTLKYLNNTQSQGILLNASDTLTLQAFYDSDWGSCPDSRRSVTGYVLQFGGSPIS